MKPKTNDPIVDEVRAVRRQHAEKFNYDIKAIFKDIQAQQEASGRKFVRFPPRKLAKTTDR